MTLLVLAFVCTDGKNYRTVILVDYLSVCYNFLCNIAALDLQLGTKTVFVEKGAIFERVEDVAVLSLFIPLPSPTLQHNTMELRPWRFP